MNEEWREMMAYAPLIEEEYNGDYQKEEDLGEVVKATSEEFEHTMPLESEDYHGAEEVAYESLIDDREAYEDYQTMPEIPMDLYFGE